jgi:squalene-hopene/tetraprenyl-beta-curcumene cyclase
MRADGSWAIDSNLATWVTTLSINALAAGGGLAMITQPQRRKLIDWLLAQQCRTPHPYTRAAPGGWAWTDLPGGVPDADDTAGALVALSHLGPDEADVREAAAMGVAWLLDLQNRDGGIPTFCRGWGTLPFDRSATDLTAHALRAWAAWRHAMAPALAARTDRATVRAIAYLARNQGRDGAFTPLWFGNQAERCEENPVLGTSRVLTGLAIVPAHGATTQIRARALQWLTRAQNRDGGWGGGPGVPSSIEETASAISGLASSGAAGDRRTEQAVLHGLAWLNRATGEGVEFTASPIGLYFARLWYAEELYPIIFTVAAMGAAQSFCRTASPRRPAAEISPE